MLIHQATLEDIPELCSLLAILFEQEIEFQPDSENQTKGLQLLLSQPELGLILVARDDQQLLGMVSVLFSVSTALGGRVAIIEDMVVLPTARGSGIGSALLNAAINTAQTHGCHRISLLSDSTNTAAHCFYEKQGFSRSQMAVFRRLF